jgi:hypothetical protein
LTAAIAIVAVGASAAKPLVAGSVATDRATRSEDGQADAHQPLCIRQNFKLQICEFKAYLCR